MTLTKPGHTVKWFLNGVELTDSDKFKPKQVDELKFSLDINDVLLSDDGPLKCVVFNEKGEEVASSECKVNVREIPLDFVKGLGNIKCMEKDEVKFECKLNKEVPLDQIAWYRDGEKLADGADTQILQDGPVQYLVIKGAAVDDTGNYDIRVKGIKSTGNLKVKG